MQTEGRTGKTKLMVAFHKFAKATKFASLYTFWNYLKQKNHVAVRVKLHN